MDLKENARQAAEAPHTVVVDDDTARRGAVHLGHTIRGRGMNGVAAVLAMAAGMIVSSGDATVRAVDAGRRLADSLSKPKYRLSVPSKVGKRNAMSVATARRTAAKKRRVKAHRARR